jgi:hypothetical protein
MNCNYNQFWCTPGTKMWCKKSFRSRVYLWHHPQNRGAALRKVRGKLSIPKFSAIPPPMGWEGRRGERRGGEGRGKANKISPQTQILSTRTSLPSPEEIWFNLIYLKLDGDEIPTATPMFPGMGNSRVQPTIMCDIDINIENQDGSFKLKKKKITELLVTVPKIEISKRFQRRNTVFMCG